MNEMVRVQRLQHVSVPRPRGSADQARRFYGGILGLEEITVPATLAPLDLVWYRLGDDELHLFGDERGAGHPAQHFCLQVDDVDALRRRLAAAGVAIGEEPEILNRPRFTILDPFGNLIEVTTILVLQRRLCKTAVFSGKSRPMSRLCWPSAPIIAAIRVSTASTKAPLHGYWKNPSL